MTQVPTSTTTAPRRMMRPDMDVYTALAVAGTFALLVATAILWIRGTAMAGGEMPWTILK